MGDYSFELEKTIEKVADTDYRISMVIDGGAAVVGGSGWSPESLFIARINPDNTVNVSGELADFGPGPIVDHGEVSTFDASTRTFTLNYKVTVYGWYYLIVTETYVKR